MLTKKSIIFFIFFLTQITCVYQELNELLKKMSSTESLNGIERSMKQIFSELSLDRAELQGNDLAELIADFFTHDFSKDIQPEQSPLEEQVQKYVEEQKLSVNSSQEEIKRIMEGVFTIMERSVSDQLARDVDQDIVSSLDIVVKEIKFSMDQVMDNGIETLIEEKIKAIFSAVKQIARIKNQNVFLEKLLASVGNKFANTLQFLSDEIYLTEFLKSIEQFMNKTQSEKWQKWNDTKDEAILKNLRNEYTEDFLFYQSIVREVFNDFNKDYQLDDNVKSDYKYLKDIFALIDAIVSFKKENKKFNESQIYFIKKTFTWNMVKLKEMNSTIKFRQNSYNQIFMKLLRNLFTFEKNQETKTQKTTKKFQYDSFKNFLGKKASVWDESLSGTQQLFFFYDLIEQIDPFDISLDIYEQMGKHIIDIIDFSDNFIDFAGIKANILLIQDLPINDSTSLAIFNIYYSYFTQAKDQFFKKHLNHKENKDLTNQFFIEFFNSFTSNVDIPYRQTFSVFAVFNLAVHDYKIPKDKGEGDQDIQNIIKESQNWNHLKKYFNLLAKQVSENPFDSLADKTITREQVKELEEILKNQVII